MTDRSGAQRERDRRLEQTKRFERHSQTSEKSAAAEAYSMASEIVLLLNRAINEERNPERREALIRALSEARAGADHIARALEVDAFT